MTLTLQQFLDPDLLIQKSESKGQPLKQINLNSQDTQEKKGHRILGRNKASVFYFSRPVQWRKSCYEKQPLRQVVGMLMSMDEE